MGTGIGEILVLPSVGGLSLGLCWTFIEMPSPIVTGWAVCPTYGKIPESICLLKGLRFFNLSSNALTSNIPLSLGNLTNLEALDLSWNQLPGQIPRDLGILYFLSTMNFAHNNLEGSIPRGTQFRIQNLFFIHWQESEEVLEPEEMWLAGYQRQYHMDLVFSMDISSFHTSTSGHG